MLGAPQRPARLSLSACSIGEFFNRLQELYGTRYVLGEDRCWVRFPPVASMLAVLNSVVLSLMDLHQISRVSRQLRHFASHPDEALAWVLDF